MKSFVVSTMEDFQKISSEVVNITFASKCGNDMNMQTLDLSAFKSLEKVTVQDNCFKYCTRVIVSHLPKLQSLEVGYHSFSFMEYLQIMQFTIAPREATLTVEDCAALTSVQIGRQSFVDFSTCDFSSE